MADAIQVELGGGDPPGQPTSGAGGGRTLWLLIGLGLGIALSFLFSIPAGVDPLIGDGTSTTTSAVPASGVEGTVPDFPDGLNVLVSPGEGRALEVLTWPLRGEPVYRSVPLGDIDLEGTARFDASGHFLAATTATPTGSILQIGRPNTFGVVASGVTGFAWHDSDPADLAWSTFDEGELRLWVSEDLAVGEVAVSAVGVGDRLAAFGGWGFAVSEESGVFDEAPAFRTAILARSGEILATVPGRVVASHNSGLLLLAHRGEASVILVGGDSGFSIELTSVMDDPSVVGARFSPDGTRVAITGFSGVTVVAVDGTSDPETFGIRAGSESLSWSSDGRFVLVSAFRGVAVIDTQTGEITSILESETTRAVATTPIAGT